MLAAGAAHASAVPAAWPRVLVGFVFAMIFGHAPIALLQASVVIRVAGDLSLAWSEGGLGRARAWGGALGAVAILLFLLSTVASLRFADGARARAAP